MKLYQFKNMAKTMHKINRLSCRMATICGNSPTVTVSVTHKPWHTPITRGLLWEREWAQVIK